MWGLRPASAGAVQVRPLHMRLYVCMFITKIPYGTWADDVLALARFARFQIYFYQVIGVRSDGREKETWRDAHHQTPTSSSHPGDRGRGKGTSLYPNSENPLGINE